MTDKAPRSKKDETYTEEMQRWMARQSFWYRLKHGRRHPDSRPFWVSLFIFAAWMVPLLAISAFAFYVLLTNYMAGDSFTKLVAQECGKILGLHNPTVVSGQWKRGVFSVNGLEGEGLAGGWIRRIKLDSARCEISGQEIFSDAWQPGNLTLQGLELEFRGGLLGPLEAERVARDQSEADARRREAIVARGEDPGPFKGAFGVAFNGTLFEVNKLQARNSTLRWGGSEKSAGMLVGTTIDAERVDKEWLIRCTGGAITQGWLRDAEVVEIVMETTPTAINVKKLEFRLKLGEGKQGKEGIGQGEGRIVLTAAPQVELTVLLQGVEVNRLLSPAYQGIFAGRVQGRVAVTGSTNKEAGISTEGAFEFLPGFGFGVAAAEFLPVLEVLGGEVADVPLRYLEAARGGVRFVLNDTELKTEGLTIESSDGERIEGTYTHEFLTKRIRGVVRVGMKPGQFLSHPLLVERYFREEGGGLRWMTIPMDGPLSGITGSVADGLRAAVKAEAEAREKRP